MFYLDSNTNKRYRIGTPFTYGGVQYTRAGASHATFMSLGFTQVTVAQRPDSRFYVVTGPDNTGAYTKTNRDLTELKKGFVKAEKTTSFQLLASTDWYVLRFIDLGFMDPNGAIPTAIKNYRNNIRTVSNERCLEINDCQTVEEVETLIKAPATLINSETQESYTNPAAMTQWPTLDTETYSVYS